MARGLIILVPRRRVAGPLFVMGLGVGIMLTASVNLVQSAWPENVQGDISGVSRSVSNLGSSLGVAIAGSLAHLATKPRKRRTRSSDAVVGGGAGPAAASGTV